MSRFLIVDDRFCLKSNKIDLNVCDSEKSEYYLLKIVLSIAKIGTKKIYLNCYLKININHFG